MCYINQYQSWFPTIWRITAPTPTPTDRYPRTGPSPDSNPNVVSALFSPTTTQCTVSMTRICFTTTTIT